MERVRKHAFPGWLRRIDPFLATEDENLLFQFFRERRARSGGWGWKVRGPIIATVLLASTIYFVENLVVLRAVLFTSLTFAAILVYWVFEKRKGQGDSAFPRGTRGFLPVTAVNPLLITDVWMAGVTGKDIAEGAALDTAELMKPYVYTVAAGLPTLAICLFLNLPLPLSDRLLLIGSALFTAIPLSIISLSFVILAGSATIDNLTDVLLKHLDYRRFLGKAFWQILMVAGIMASLYLVLGFAVVSPVMDFLKLARTALALADAQVMASRLFFVGVAFCVAVRPLIRWMKSWRRRLIEDAGPLFEEFIRVAIVGDRDA